jgi:hypothetical protein
MGMYAEVWMSPDRDRTILYRYYDDEVELGIDMNDYNERLSMIEDEFKFVFYNWIKIGNL